jgi:hypothetical protein
VGGRFVIGDHENVLKLSCQMVFNPFQGRLLIYLEVMELRDLRIRCKGWMDALSPKILSTTPTVHEIFGFAPFLSIMRQTLLSGAKISPKASTSKGAAKKSPSTGTINAPMKDKIKPNGRMINPTVRPDHFSFSHSCLSIVNLRDGALIKKRPLGRLL